MSAQESTDRSASDHSTIDVEDGHHLVSLYEDEGYLNTTVASFLAPALLAGDAAVAVATPAHRHGFTDALTVAGVDVSAAVADGTLVMLDASDLIDGFLRDGHPDPTAFRSVVGHVLARAADGGRRRVRVFGEMVALLWDRGNVPAVLALEDAWNALAEEHPFALFCAYPLAAFDGSDAAQTFRHVLSQHSHVLPSERLAGLEDDDERARLVAVLNRDLHAGVAERDRLREDRDALQASLSDLRDVDALRNEFVSMVVHDIQSPSTVIGALLDLLRDGWQDMTPDMVEAHLSTALASVRRIDRLTADILTVARLDSGHFSYDLRAIDLGALARRAADDVAEASQRRIAVTADADLPPARADADRQLQVLTNLLTNAVKFSDGETAVEVRVVAEPERLVVHVRDEGVGIAATEVDALFVPFSRLSDQGQRRTRGTGLGLYTARALVEGQGGEIWVASEPGRGSTFSYSVPLAPDPAAR